VLARRLVLPLSTLGCVLYRLDFYRLNNLDPPVWVVRSPRQSQSGESGALPDERKPSAIAPLTRPSPGSRATASSSSGSSACPCCWHVERLTAGAAPMAALAFSGSDACDLLHRLLEVPEISAQVPGVHSSDFAAYPVHPLMLRPAISAAAVAA
jgi:hypothetical protein